MIPDSFFHGIPSIRANAQHAIIEESGAPEYLSKKLFWLKSWRKPEFVYILNFHSHTLTEIGENTGFGMSEADPYPYSALRPEFSGS